VLLGHRLAVLICTTSISGPSPWGLHIGEQLNDANLGRNLTTPLEVVDPGCDLRAEQGRAGRGGDRVVTRWSGPLGFNAQPSHAAILR